MATVKRYEGVTEAMATCMKRNGTAAGTKYDPPEGNRGIATNSRRPTVVIWNRRDLKGLAFNMAIAVAVAALANAFIFFVNPAEDLAPTTNLLQPPGWVIGLVWIVLFIFLGTARWLLIQNVDPPFQGTRWVWLLLLFCAAYPIYTSGLNNLEVGLGGNVATAALAVWVALRIRKTSIVAAGLVSTVALWVTFAGFLIVEQMKRQH